MATLHQMGHHTANLIGKVPGYSGAILSPVNMTEDSARSLIEEKQSPAFSFILDPQLYFPKSGRGELPKWSHFPSDADTSDVSSSTWWSGVGQQLLACASSLGIRRVCSPASVPASYSKEYYAFTARVAGDLSRDAASGGVQVLSTVLWPIDELITRTRVMETASIISKSRCRSVYLILDSTTRPRLEHRSAEAMRAAMRLIRELSRAGMEVVVGFTGSDAPMFATAGASACATGKNMNLRRFSRTRFDEPSEGGQQLPYWFEEALLASIRGSDLVRLETHGLLSPVHETNPFAMEILSLLKNEPSPKWVALGWCQYMHWFADMDHRIRAGTSTMAELLLAADKAWGRLEADGLFMEERTNDGSWIRPWRRALMEFDGAW